MYNRTVWNMVIFVLVALLSGWIGVMVDSVMADQPEGGSLGMGVWLVLPMLTVILSLCFTKSGFREIGFRPNIQGNVKWYVASLLIFPVVTGIVLLIGAGTGWIDFSGLDFSTFFGVFAGMLAVNFIKNIFEETIWRGFLTSQLVKLHLSDWKVYLIVGCVWGAWHIPYYLVFLPEADMEPVLPVGRMMFAVVAFLTMICWAVMFIELYRVTKSIWPCIILHMVEDSLVNPLVISGYIHIVPSKEIVLSPINGIVTTLLYLAVGFGIRAYRKSRETILHRPTFKY